MPEEISVSKPVTEPRISVVNAVRDGLRILRTIVAERRQARRSNQQAGGVVIELRGASVANDRTAIAARIQGARGA